MANPEHLKILRLGVEVWNRWRADNPTAEPDLASADLRSLEDYHIVDFSGWRAAPILEQQFAKLVDGLKLFYQGRSRVNLWPPSAFLEQGNYRTLFSCRDAPHDRKPRRP